MKVIAPRVVNDAILSTTNLVETDNLPYAPTTTYAKGARVRRASVFDFTSGNLPAGSTLARATSGTYTAGNGLVGTAGPNVARFEYAGGVCLGLLVEPQRTNTLTYSEQFDAAFWQKIGGAPGAAPVVTTNYAASPDSVVTAERVQFQAGASGGGISIFVPGASSVTSGTIYAGSIHVRLTSAATGSMASYLQNQGTGSLTSAAQPLTAAWTRVGLQRTSDSTGMFFVFGAYPEFGGDRSIDVLLWGAQLEDGPRTSYIPTTTAAVTRAADVLTLNWAAKGATDGSYTARYTFDDGSTQDLATTVSGGFATVPTASLDRTTIARAALTALLDGVRVYESLQPNNLGHALTDPSWWLDAGPTNRWAMFDGAVGSLSRANGSISVTLRPDVAIDSLAALEVTAASVKVQITAGGSTIYDQTKVPGAGPASVLFLGLPVATNTTVSVTIAGATGATPVTAGALLIGNLADLGLTEAGPSIGINDFSRRETDAFGVTTVVERGWAKRMSIKSKVETSAVADLQQRLTTLRALPSLWIGEEGYDSLVIYGFFKEFAVDLALETISYVTLTIEGMTTASDLDRDTPDGYDALQAQVTSALDRIGVIQSDGYLSAGEKPDVIREATDIANEYADIVAKAVTLGVPSVGYGNAYNALVGYLSGLAPAYTDTTTDTAIAAATFNARFADYYLARTTLLNAVTAKAATLASWSGTTGVGKPADNATRNDDAGNLIRGVKDLSFLTIAGGVSKQVNAGVTGRPADKVRMVFAGATGIVFWDECPCGPGERLYYRDAVTADGQNADTSQAIMQFVRSDGTIITNVAIPGTQIVSSDFPTTAFRYRSGYVDSPPDCAGVRPYVERVNNGGGGGIYVGEPYLGKAKPGADITAEAQVIVGEFAEVILPASSAGVVTAGVLPIAINTKVTRGGVDIHAQAGTTFALANVSPSLSGSNGDLSIDNSSSASKGMLNLSTLSGSGSADVIVTVDGRAQPAKRIIFTIQRAPAPSAPATGSGGTGGGAGSSTAGSVSGKSVTSAAFAQAILLSNLAVPAGKTLTAALSCEYSVSGTTTGSQSIVGKFQYAPTGTSSWTDFGSTVAGSQSTVYTRGDVADPGRLDASQSASPAAANYDVRFVWALSSGTRGVYTTDGPVSVSISA